MALEGVAAHCRAQRLATGCSSTAHVEPGQLIFNTEKGSKNLTHYMQELFLKRRESVLALDLVSILQVHNNTLNLLLCLNPRWKRGNNGGLLAAFFHKQPCAEGPSGGRLTWLNNQMKAWLCNAQFISCTRNANATPSVSRVGKRCAVPVSQSSAERSASPSDFPQTGSIVCVAPGSCVAAPPSRCRADYFVLIQLRVHPLSMR